MLLSIIKRCPVTFLIWQKLLIKSTQLLGGTYFKVQRLELREDQAYHSYTSILLHSEEKIFLHSRQRSEVLAGIKEHDTLSLMLDYFSESTESLVHIQHSLPVALTHFGEELRVFDAQYKIGL